VRGGIATVATGYIRGVTGDTWQIAPARATDRLGRCPQENKKGS
jgi:hypothetical protein